jgi:hypothetical protein
MNYPMGRKLLHAAIDDAATGPSGPCHADEMVTLVANDDGTLTVRKFKLADISDSDWAQLKFLHEVLLDECPVKPFKDWAHLEARGKSRYPNGTGYGRQLVEGVLKRHGVEAPRAYFDILLEEGYIKSLGMFDAAVGGGPFEMFAAIPRESIDTYA